MTMTTAAPADVGQRTEVELVAQALWVLRQHKLVDQSRSWLNSACGVLGLDVERDVGAAMLKLGSQPTKKWDPPHGGETTEPAAPAIEVGMGSTRQPGLPQTHGGRPPGASQASQEPRTSASRGLPPPKPELLRPATTTRPESDGRLFCRAHNGEGAWVDKRFFSLRADRPGHYRSWCDECTSAYSAAKYLSAATMRALHDEGVCAKNLPPALVSQPCPVCRESFAPDDVLVAVATPTLVHRDGCR